MLDVVKLLVPTFSQRPPTFISQSVDLSSAPNFASSTDVSVRLMRTLRNPNTP